MRTITGILDSRLEVPQSARELECHASVFVTQSCVSPIYHPKVYPYTLRVACFSMAVCSESTVNKQS